MSLPISSCCINNENNAWITCYNGTIWGIDDLTNTNAVWNQILMPPEGAKQIVCNTWATPMIVCINQSGKVYYATTNLLTNPNWTLVNFTRGYVKYISLYWNNSFSAVNTSNEIWSSTLPINQVTGLPDKKDIVQNSTTNITYNKDKGAIGEINGIAVISDGDAAYAAIISAGNIYVTTVLGQNSNPSWQVRVFGGNTITNVAFGRARHLLWVDSGDNMGFKTMWDDGNTMGYVSGGGFKFCSFGSNNNFITIKTDDTVVWGVTNQTKNTIINGLPNPAYYGKKYYGNKVPVTKNPITINLTNVPVSFWTQDIHYNSHGCGGSSNCNLTALNRETKPYNSSGYAIETPVIAKGTNDVWYSASSGCGLGNIQTYCWVPESYTTHVFGDGTGTTSIPLNKNQYANPSALDLQITPFNKKYNSQWNNGQDYSKFVGFGTKPTFEKISFNIPDPSEPIMIDANIPYILLSYYKLNQYTDINGLNNYLNAWAFTPVINSLDNKIVPRHLAYQYGSMKETVMSTWQAVIANTYSVNANQYCSGLNLNTSFCYDYCKNTSNNCDSNLLEFCRSSGTGTSKLPALTPGILSNTPITLDMLKQAYPKYFDNSKKTCGCFMPDDFYNYLDQSSFQKINTKPEDFTALYQRKVIGIGGGKCDPFASCAGSDIISRKSQKDFNCPPINLQQCIQNNTTDMSYGEGNTSINNQTMSCVQNIEGPPLPSNVAADKAAADKAAADKAAADKVVADKAAVVKAAADKVVADKAAADKVVADKAAVVKAAADKVAADKARSNMMIAIIIAVILIVLGGGAFVILK